LCPHFKPCFFLLTIFSISFSSFAFFPPFTSQAAGFPSPKDLPFSRLTSFAPEAFRSCSFLSTCRISPLPSIPPFFGQPFLPSPPHGFVRVLPRRRSLAFARPVTFFSPRSDMAPPFPLVPPCLFSCCFLLGFFFFFHPVIFKRGFIATSPPFPLAFPLLIRPVRPFLAPVTLCHTFLAFTSFCPRRFLFPLLRRRPPLGGRPLYPPATPFRSPIFYQLQALVPGPTFFPRFSFSVQRRFP